MSLRYNWFPWDSSRWESIDTSSWVDNCRELLDLRTKYYYYPISSILIRWTSSLSITDRLWFDWNWNWDYFYPFFVPFFSGLFFLLYVLLVRWLWWLSSDFHSDEFWTFADIVFNLVAVLRENFSSCHSLPFSTQSSEGVFSAKSFDCCLVPLCRLPHRPRVVTRKWNFWKGNKKFSLFASRWWWRHEWSPTREIVWITANWAWVKEKSSFST